MNVLSIKLWEGKRVGFHDCNITGWLHRHSYLNLPLSLSLKLFCVMTRVGGDRDQVWNCKLCRLSLTRSDAEWEVISWIPLCSKSLVSSPQIIPPIICKGFSLQLFRRKTAARRYNSLSDFLSVFLLNWLFNKALFDQQYPFASNTIHTR